MFAKLKFHRLNLFSFRSVALILSAVIFTACASRVLKVKNVEEIKKNEEFDRVVQIEAADNAIVPTPPAVAPSENLPKETGKVVEPAAPIETPKKDLKSPPKKSKKQVTKEVKKTEPVVIRRQPELESDIGFQGRRPIRDPFRVGEKLVHDVRWMKFNAGTMTLEVLPFAKVNGRLNYNFKLSIRTSSIFSTFYSVDDFVTTLVDYETLVPSVFRLSMRESGQVRESQAFFDAETKQAKFWEKKVTDKEGETQRKLEWAILDYSQNVYSAVFYLRNFTYTDGSVHPFRVSNESENLIFKAKFLRRETLNTRAGKFNAIVITPEVELQGKFKPIGENLMWLSDDDRKYILRIESKISMGTLVSEVTEIVPGQ